MPVTYWSAPGSNSLSLRVTGTTFSRLPLPPGFLLVSANGIHCRKLEGRRGQGISNHSPHRSVVPARVPPPQLSDSLEFRKEYPMVQNTGYLEDYHLRPIPKLRMQNWFFSRTCFTYYKNSQLFFFLRTLWVLPGSVFWIIIHLRPLNKTVTWWNLLVHLCSVYPCQAYIVKITTPINYSHWPSTNMPKGWLHSRKCSWITHGIFWKMLKFINNS